MIRAVARALAIFDVFDQEHLSLSLHEMVMRLDMPKATVFRLVNTLEKSGFLVRLDNQQYCLSHKLTRLAGLVLASVSMRDIARPVMREVNRLTGETITLNIIDGHNRLCIDAVDTPSPLMSIARPGDRVPLLYGATSRILLAYMSSEEREQVLAAIPESAQADRVTMERELQRFVRQGYALTRSQRVQGVTAIAVPVRGGDGSVRECLALTGPSARVDSRDSEFIEIMVEASRNLSRATGAPVPLGQESAEGRDVDGDRSPAPAVRKRATKGKKVATHDSASNLPSAEDIAEAPKTKRLTRRKPPMSEVRRA